MNEVEVCFWFQSLPKKANIGVFLSGSAGNKIADAPSVTADYLWDIRKSIGSQ